MNKKLDCKVATNESKPSSCEDMRYQELHQQLFSNSLILEQIAKKCSFKDLKNVRLVSKSFREASITVWKKDASISLGLYLGPEGGNCLGVPRITVDELLRLRRTLNPTSLEYKTVKPVHNYTLYFLPLPPVDYPASDREIVAEFRFWNECGDEIKYLKMIACMFDDKILVNLICNLAPNLERLDIKETRIMHPAKEIDRTLWKNHNLKALHISGYLPFPNWRFLEYFPNLKEIKVSGNSTAGLMSDLHHLRSQSRKNLSKLEILNVARTQQSLEGLAEAQLSLKNLSFCVGRDVKDRQVLEMLNLLCKTLECLTFIREGERRNPIRLTHFFPRFQCPLQTNFTVLKELHLWGNVTFNFDFLKWMPSLTKLMVEIFYVDYYEYYCYYVTDYASLGRRDPANRVYGDMVQDSHILLEADNFVHENLEYFSIDQKFCSESLSILGKWMPGLKSFAGILNNQTLSLVCEQWSSLEKLNLLFGSNVCDTGIKNLTKLQNLHSFDLDCHCDSARITDTSVYQTFIQMPRLGNLRVPVSPEFSNDAEASLRASKNGAITILRKHGERSMLCTCEFFGRSCKRRQFYSETKL